MFFLTGNTTQDEFKEIFYSNDKLSHVFNDFYDTSILSGNPSTTVDINFYLENTSGITYS